MQKVDWVKIDILNCSLVWLPLLMNLLDELTKLSVS